MMKDGMITHSHWSCSTSCHFYTRMIRAIAEGSSKEVAFKQAGNYIVNWGWRIAEQHDEPIENSLFNRLLSDSFHYTPEHEIRSTGYVIDSLEAAVWAFMTGTDYKSIVLKAVNLGGDTDTIAALAGGLAGIYYGSGFRMARHHRRQDRISLTE